MSFKKNKPAAPVKPAANEEKNYPCAHLFGAIKEGEEWKEEKITGMFLDLKPCTEKNPDGSIRLSGKIKEDITLPAGTTFKLKINGAMEAIGIKPYVNEDGEVSFEQV